MYRFSRYFVGILALLKLLNVVNGDTYNVKIGSEEFVNLVDERFLSFTVDPQYLFTSGESLHSKECFCMATSLIPAYLRIAGTSTSRMVFKNSTIALNDVHEDMKQESETYNKRQKKNKINFELPNKRFKRKQKDFNLNESKKKNLEVTSRQWKKFINWAKSTGFDLVFALNNEERINTGMWDPNTALSVLTIAEKTNLSNIYWQLGYECTNQTIEDYINDLQTLRVIVDTFPHSSPSEWKAVAGDVTSCIRADSKSDFKDYVTLSAEMMNAVMLNGNSSSAEVARLPPPERQKLLEMLSESNTPLWLTDKPQIEGSQLPRAVDWIASLGYAAKNGFSVYFRELAKEELYEPTLSFYMALLYKHLVGERVLDVELDASQAVLFAHCTSLHRKPVPGAVTIYGANMDDEPARFSIKMSKIEEGGDIMQFILTIDVNGNIIVNGRTMFYDGDIKPIVKRVRPYKKLLLSLPPKSFGFWVLANANVSACHDIAFEETVNETNSSIPNRSKREILSNNQNLKEKCQSTSSKEVFNRIQNINSDIKRIKKRKHNKIDNVKTGKRKTIALRKTNYRNSASNDIIPKSMLYNKIKLLKQKTNDTKTKFEQYSKYPIKRRYSKRFQNKKDSLKRFVYFPTNEVTDNKDKISSDKLKRFRRNVISDYKMKSKSDESSKYNEIDTSFEDNLNLKDIVRKINHRLKELPELKDMVGEIVDDGTIIKNKHITENDFENEDYLDDEDKKSGWLKSSLRSVLSVILKLNKKLNRFWDVVQVLD